MRIPSLTLADISHQWIFVTDTTDAALPPEHYSPEALVDRLAEILVESASATKVGPNLPLHHPS